jgi:release factor glutamine methyltransferase
MKPLTVAHALAKARACGVDSLDAQLLLAKCLARSRSWLIAHDDALLSPETWGRYRGWLARRGAGEPLAYLFGEKEFHGLMLQVDARVLVPRPDTETLVEWALDVLRSALAEQSAPRVIDLGTGSGAIALALKHACPRADVTALDASQGALAVAQANAAALQLDLRLLASHWWSAVPGERFHLAVSNPPYIAEHDPHLGALAHEPGMALIAGADGLQALRHIIEAGRAHLEPGGWLLLEHGHDQGHAVQSMLTRQGFTQVQNRHDVGGNWRCTGGQA